MTDKPPCKSCGDTGWVCENHPDQPWEDAPNSCHCGAGMPCNECNPCDEYNLPRMPSGTTQVWHRDKGTVQ